ncbi:MAG: hypothetical protein IJ689_03925 [Alphaproteobacteria bacterium]|nr:hypothetical protein [Alphaproteobacteria bacterium]
MNNKKSPEKWYVKIWHFICKEKVLLWTFRVLNTLRIAVEAMMIGMILVSIAMLLFVAMDSLGWHPLRLNEEMSVWILILIAFITAGTFCGRFDSAMTSARRISRMSPETLKANFILAGVIVIFVLTVALLIAGIVALYIWIF